MINIIIDRPKSVAMNFVGSSMFGNFIKNEYHPINFEYTLIEPKEFDNEGLDRIKQLNIVNL